MNFELLENVLSRADLGPIGEKVFAGKRLSFDEGVALFRSRDLNAVGALANWMREKKHGHATFFNTNQHINYTNICNKKCLFCAFQRLPGQEGAYSMTPEQAASRIRDLLDEPVTEVHMVGGIDPKLPYDYYLDLLRAVKRARPSIHIKAFTMVEIEEIQRQSGGKSLEEVFADLKEAGLGSLPGGGPEVFAERVHQAIFPLKIGADRWLEIAKTAHRCGLKSNCTMLYGHIETVEERVDHLIRLREAQDETGGFQTYIPLRFHPENTEMSHIPAPTGFDDLQNIAVARLLLDNIPHIKAYWIMLGQAIAQIALSFGADDIDGTVAEEKIYHEAGATTPQSMTRQELMRLICAAGRVPVERDTLYNIVEKFPAGEAALAVT